MAARNARGASGAFAAVARETFPFDAAATGLADAAQARTTAAPHNLRVELIFDITLKPLAWMGSAAERGKRRQRSTSGSPSRRKVLLQRKRHWDGHRFRVRSLPWTQTSAVQHPAVNAAALNVAGLTAASAVAQNSDKQAAMVFAGENRAASKISRGALDASECLPQRCPAHH
jgi:hypothetical protein